VPFDLILKREKIMDRIINLRDFKAKTLEERLALAKREYPGIHIQYAGRPSALGNPYELFGNETKDLKKINASIAQYRVWLWAKLQSEDKAILAEFDLITADTILACWCYPLPCHSQVIWAARHWLKSKERIRSAVSA
jgi:hypothetical protein